MATPLSEQIELACLMEATARKPGNVHPAARFADLEFDDFRKAAAVSAPWLARSLELGIGPAILQATLATRSECASNVNLGICLLVAPIAAAADPKFLRQQVAEGIEKATQADADAVYQAIRAAHPGGLGDAPEQDVAAPPTVTLLEAMSLAEERDRIAYEWSTRFRGIDRDGVQWLRTAWQTAHSLYGSAGFPMPDGIPAPAWEVAILATQMEWMTVGDTLIQRKCGPAIYQESIDRAQRVLQRGSWETEAGRAEMQSLDQWLRADGHRRNPGTTADLIVACLLWAFRKGWVTPPTRCEVLQHAARIAATACPLSTASMN